MEGRLIDIEMAVTRLEKMAEDLNEMVIEQGKQIEILKKQNMYLLQVCKENDIKPLSEETPPPHY